MNIDSPSLNSLFSPVDGLEQLQQSLQSDGLGPGEFSDALKESIRQLVGMNEVAGAINKKGGVPGFSSLLGKDLPKINHLETNIDLEHTLEMLSNVMKTLEAVLPQEFEAPQVLSLEDLNLEGLNSEEVNFEGKLDNLLEKIESFKTFLSNPTEFIEKLNDIFARDDDLENSILSLLDETKFNNPSDENDLIKFLEKFENKIYQIKELNSNAPTALEAGKVSKLVLSDIKPEFKNENIVQKLMAEDKAIDNTQNSESDTLLQQENAFRKPGQENPVILAKQNEKALLLNEVNSEQSTDKPLPKLAADIAMLNKSLMSANKAELPPMSKQFSSPQWNKEIGERIIWMHKQEIPSAELKLNPRHLGPITIRIDTTQDQATVAFTAQHAIVKEAIEAALPKLRDMFSAQQLNLVDVNVSQDDSGQRQPKNSAQMGNEQGRDEHKDTEQMTHNDQEERLMEIVDEIEAGRAIASNGILSIFA